MGPVNVPIVVMGVAGCGKSTVGSLLADRLGRPYSEADDFHPARNITKMAQGLPLDDADRQPWLRAIGRRIVELRGDLVVSCSALRRSYRDLLRQADARTMFVHLLVDERTASARVAARPGHFMPAALVASQFAALEPLQPDEAGVLVESCGDVMAVADAAQRAIETRLGLTA